MPPPAADDQAGTACRPSRRPVDWHWATPQAQRILADGHLGEILRFHRAIHSLSQAQLAGILGYDKTYISALETGKRALDDVGSCAGCAPCYMSRRTFSASPTRPTAITVPCFSSANPRSGWPKSPASPVTLPKRSPNCGRWIWLVPS